MDRVNLQMLATAVEVTFSNLGFSWFIFYDLFYIFVSFQGSALTEYGFTFAVHSIADCTSEFNIVALGLGHACQGTEDFYWCMGVIFAGCHSCRCQWLVGTNRHITHWLTGLKSVTLTTEPRLLLKNIADCDRLKNYELMSYITRFVIKLVNMMWSW